MDIETSIDWQKGFIQNIIDQCGPRLPGSAEERKSAQIIAEEFKKVAGNVKIEEFTVHPMAFIGWIPIAGILLLISSALILISPWLTAIIIGITLIFALIQFLNYLEFFDFLFPKATSQNVYSVIEPPSGVPEYTIMLSGHMDSSWGWILSEKNPQRLRYKIPYGIVSGVIVMLLAILRILETYYGEGLGLGFSISWLFLIIPLAIPGFIYITKYLSWHRKNASPGAMDNLAGIAQSISIVRYLMNNPHDYPPNCRIIMCAFGSEEAGLRGSRRFAERHKHDLLAGDVWALNIDGVSDVEHFNLMKGEIMLRVNYNKDLVNIVTESMREFGLYRPFWKLDVGASDAVTFCRMGKRAYTFAAQDNTPRNNYHTRFDLLENMDVDALRKMMILVLRVIEKIGQYKQDYKPQWLEDYVVQSRGFFKTKKKQNHPNQ